MSASVLSLLFLALVMACEKKVRPEPEEITIVDSETSSFRRAAGDLYLKSAGGHADENFVISPLSIQLALYMAWSGAEEETKEEIESLLHLDDVDEDKIKEGLSDLMQYYRQLVKKGHLDIYNGVFYDKNRIEVREKFMDDIQNYFDGEAQDLDFFVEKSVAVINDWVKKRTGEKIPEVLDEITDQELLFLLNVLYLKADWQEPFPVESTADRPFYPEEGEEILLPTMFRTGVIELYEDSSLQMVRLALADSALFVYYVIPKEGGSLAELRESDLLNRLGEGKIDFQSRRVMLSLPVVETRTHLVLNPVLQGLGMMTSFDPQKARYEGIGEAGTGRPVFLSRVLHDAYIRMDEKGVEGAAVTTIGLGTTSAPPSIVFDRPFMYLVMDRALNLPVFMGQFVGRS